MTADEIQQRRCGWRLIGERERRNNPACNPDLGEDRAESMARHADLMQALYEIAYQLALLTEREDTKALL